MSRPAASAPMRGYSSTEAARLAGVTYRQLDYWSRTGLVRASLAEARGSGSQRRYSEEDIVCLRAVRRLHELGVSHRLNQNMAARRVPELVVEAIRGDDPKPIPLVEGVLIEPFVLAGIEGEAKAAA